MYRRYDKLMNDYGAYEFEASSSTENLVYCVNGRTLELLRLDRLRPLPLARRISDESILIPF